MKILTYTTLIRKKTFMRFLIQKVQKILMIIIKKKILSPSSNFLGLTGRARKVFPLTGKAHDVACPSLTCTNPYITPGDLTNVKTLHGVFEHVVVKDEVQQGLCGGVQGTSLYGSRGCGFCLHIDIKHNRIDVIISI